MTHTLAKRLRGTAQPRADGAVGRKNNELKHGEGAKTNRRLIRFRSVTHDLKCKCHVSVPDILVSGSFPGVEGFKVLHGRAPLLTRRFRRQRIFTASISNLPLDLSVQG